MPVRVRSRSVVAKTRVHRHDFSFQSGEGQHRPPLPGKIKILLTLASACLLGVLGLLLFHPAFRIAVISINGLERTDYAEIRATAENTLQDKRFGFLPRNNYFLVNTNELKGIISDRFHLGSVMVKKKFPNSLIIDVQERQAAVVVLKDNAFTAVDINGLAVQKLGRVDVFASSTGPSLKLVGSEWKDFPFLVYPAGFATNQEKDKQLVVGVLAWNNFLKDSLETRTVSYTIQTPTSGEIKTGEGWRILVNFIDNREEQFTALTAAFKQPKFSPKSIKYIDVRYPGKVYWQ